MPSLDIVHPARRTRRETITPGSGGRRVSRRGTDECEIPPLDMGGQAIQLSPYRAGGAGRCPTRLRPSPAFRPCSCPLALSGLGQVVASESFALNSGPLWGQFLPCVPWRTISAHLALTVQPVPAGA